MRPFFLVKESAVTNVAPIRFPEGNIFAVTWRVLMNYLQVIKGWKLISEGGNRVFSFKGFAERSWYRRNTGIREDVF